MSPEVAFEMVDARSADAVDAIRAYFTELDAQFVEGFNDWEALTDGAADFDPPAGAFFLVRVGGDVAGCGGVRTLEPGVGEIKRMWIAPSHRGRGLAKQLLAELESAISAMGHGTVRLDTNATLTPAITMYESSGYRSIERYNDNPDAERWFEKRL